MTDQNNPESDLPVEAEGTPTPRFDSAGAQPTSGATDDVVAELQKRLTPWLTDEIGKVTQATKDRRIQKLTDRLDLTAAQLDKLAALIAGGTPKDQAVREIKLDALIDERERQQAGVPSESSQEQRPVAPVLDQDAIKRADSILTQAGVLNHPAWAEKLRTTTFKDAAQYLAAAAEFVLSEQSKTKAPNPAVVISPGGGNETRPDLKAAYLNEMKAARGQGNQKAAEIKARYRQQGLEVDSISLM